MSASSRVGFSVNFERPGITPFRRIARLAAATTTAQPRPCRRRTDPRSIAARGGAASAAATRAPLAGDQTRSHASHAAAVSWPMNVPATGSRVCAPSACSRTIVAFTGIIGSSSVVVAGRRSRPLPGAPRRSWRDRQAGGARSRRGQLPPCLMGEDDEPGAVAGVQLDHRAADVGLRGGAAGHEPLGDLIVAEAERHERQDLALTGGQLIEQLRLGHSGCRRDARFGLAPFPHAMRAVGQDFTDRAAGIRVFIRLVSDSGSCLGSSGSVKRGI